MKKYLKLFLVTIITATMLASCGANSSYVANYKGVESFNYAASTDSAMGFDMGYTTKSEVVMESESGFSGSAGTTDAAITENMEITLDSEKLVYRANVKIETLSYEESYMKLKETISSLGGIIQYESETDNDYGWYYDDHYKTRGTLQAYIKCRIPTKNYTSFMEGLGGYGKVVEKDSSVENISQRYQDTTTKMESLKIQEERLLSMLEQAVTIEEMLTIEDRLEEIRYEINSLETDVRHMDMDVAYSYVNVTLLEVMEYTPEEIPVKQNTFFDRLLNTFAESAEDFLYFAESLLFAMIHLAPYILIAAVVLTVICKIKKKSLKQLFKRKPKVQKTDNEK